MIRNVISSIRAVDSTAVQEGSTLLNLLCPSISDRLPLAFAFNQCRTATKKAGGTASQKTATIPKNLGVKMLGGELVFPGQIIVRQRGTKYHAGQGVGIGKDHTIFSKRVGFVAFSDAPHPLTNGKMKDRMTISVKALVEGDGAKAAEEEMVQRRALIKRDMQRFKPLEPSLFFPQQGMRGIRGVSRVRRLD